MHLDLTLRHFTRPAGPLLVIGTWYRDDEQQWRPCLCLIRANDEMNGAAQPCLVPSSTSWVWSEAIGDPRQAAIAAMKFAKVLRIGDTWKHAYFIARTINEHLADLIRIPPLPPGERGDKIIAEGAITDIETGTATEFEIHA